MDRTQAWAILGAEPTESQEDLMERLDAEAFSIRDHFIRQPVVPALFRSRVDRLVVLSDVANVLNIHPLGAPVSLPMLESTGTNLTEVVEHHIENLLRLRTGMAGTLDPDVLARFGTTMAALQVRYMEAFCAAVGAGSAGGGEAAPVARDEAEWEELLAAVRGEAPEGQPVVQREYRRMAALLQREGAAQ
jgi:hypothetical protein